MTVPSTLSAQQLRCLPRPKLQRLASSHGVKANVKSATIVERLLDKFPDGVPHEDGSIARKSARQKSTASSVSSSDVPTRRSSRAPRPSLRAKSERSTSDATPPFVPQDGPSGLDFGKPISKGSSPLDTLRSAMSRPRSSNLSDSGESSSSALDILADASYAELYKLESLRRLAAQMSALEAESEENLKTIKDLVEEIKVARAGRAALEKSVSVTTNQSSGGLFSKPISLPPIATLTPPPPSSSPQRVVPTPSPSPAVIATSTSGPTSPDRFSNTRKHSRSPDSDSESREDDGDAATRPMKRFKNWLVPEDCLYAVLGDDTFLPEDSDTEQFFDPDFEYNSLESDTDSDRSSDETDVEALAAENEAANTPLPALLRRTRARVPDLQGIVPKRKVKPLKRRWIPMGSGEATWWDPVDIPDDD